MRVINHILSNSSSFPRQSYFVSSSGSDSNNGTSPATPWQTLSKVNATTFVAGDHIFFKRGDTFYGSFTVNQSGTADKPIVFGAYGSGGNPIITGFANISAWTDLGSNIWESTNVVSTLTSCNIVSIGGVNTEMGRYPQSSYLAFQSHSSTTSITSSSLTGTPNWTGADIVIRTNLWLTERRAISSQSGGTLTFSALTYAPSDGWGFFIENDAKTLTYQNAWHYDPSTKKIKIYSTIQPTNINISTIDQLITIHGSYITINNISFTGANLDAIYNQTGDTYRNLTLKNCNISYCGNDGIKLKMLYLNMRNNIINECQNNGFEFTQQVDTDTFNISNNTVSNCGMLKGMRSIQGGAGSTGISTANKSNGIVEYNTVTNCGYKGISLMGTGNITRNNYVDTFCTIIGDGGGIYTYGAINHTISNNIVLNAVGDETGVVIANHKLITCGIYLDQGSSGCTVSGNIVANCFNHGIMTRSNVNIISGNTSYNNGGLAYYQFETDIHTGNTVHDNEFICTTTTGLAMEVDWPAGHTETMGTFYNNYYCRPLSEGQTIRWYSINTGAGNLTLAQWQSTYSQDSGSHTSPRAIASISEFQFEYNETNAAKNITLAYDMLDMAGTTYTAGVRALQPYTSLVLIKKA